MRLANSPHLAVVCLHMCPYVSDREGGLGAQTVLSRQRPWCFRSVPAHVSCALTSGLLDRGALISPSERGCQVLVASQRLLSAQLTSYEQVNTTFIPL